MMDKPADILVPARPDRHFQRIDRKIRAQVISDLPAENAPGEQIHHERREGYSDHPIEMKANYR